MAGFDQIVDAIIIRVEVLEVGHAVAIGIDRRILHTVAVCVEQTRFGRRFHAISQTVRSKALGQVDHIIVIGVERGDLASA